MNERRKHYTVALKMLTIEAGIYSVGSKIYNTGNKSELVKVCSLYVCAASKQEATIKAAAQIANEIEAYSSVCFSGLYMGTLKRRLQKEIEEVVKEKRLRIYAYNRRLKQDYRELEQLAANAAERKGSVISLIN